MLDIGFQSLSRMLVSGMNITVLVLDTQVYSNTGGQSSTSSFQGQATKFTVHGTVLQGNPAVNEDWYVEPKSGEVYNFIKFDRSEGRFAKHFDKEGVASELLHSANQDRLENWHTLQELAGII